MALISQDSRSSGMCITVDLSICDSWRFSGEFCYGDRPDHEVLSRIPSVFCGAIVLWSSYEQRPGESRCTSTVLTLESVFAPLILLIASLLMHPLIDTLRKGSQTKEKRTSLSSSSVNTPALLFSAFIVAIIYNLVSFLFRFLCADD